MFESFLTGIDLGIKYQTISKTVKIKAHPIFKGNDKRNLTTIPYLTISLNPSTQVVIIGSAEAYALTTALRRSDKLIPARLHTGPLRGIDTAVAAWQALQVDEVNNLISGNDSLLVVDILREGPQTRLQEALFYLTGCQYPNILMSLSHQDSKTAPLGRICRIDKPNMEGVEPDKIDTVIISDPIAGGVTQIYALGYLKKYLPKLKKVIIVAHHLAQYGSLALAGFIKASDWQAVMVGFGAWLNSRPPEMYFSPLPTDKPDYFADKRHLKLAKRVYGRAAGRIGVAGNWTAMFLAPQVGVKWFERELKEVGLTLSDINNPPIDLAEIKKMGFTPEDLEPASSYITMT